MDAILISPSPSSSVLLRVIHNQEFHPSRQLSDYIFSHQKKPTCFGGASLVVARANKRKEKAASHSFIPKPDEATGPFPEAVLLKKKVVKDDGRIAPEFADAEEEKLYEFLRLQLESDLNLERIRHYEVVYLIHENFIEEVEPIVSKVQDFVKEKKGRIWRLNNWGLRKLAYKIRKASRANYVLMNFEIEAKWINDFKAMLDKDERIIRHLVIKRDEAITADCPPPPEFHAIKEAQRVEEGYEYDDEDDEEEEDAEDDEEEDDANEEDQRWLDAIESDEGVNLSIGSEVSSCNTSKFREKIAR